MFKKLRDKLAEGGNLNIQQLINVDDGGSSNQSSIMEEASPPGEASSSLPSRQRTLSSSSSDAAVLPIHISPDRQRYIPQSDTESELEAPTVVDLNRVTKEECYAAFQRCKQKVERYKNKYGEAVKAYRSLSDEKDKVQKVLTESQDKALRRINELREQADLEQKAKAHLEENLRIIIDEKDEQLKVMRTKIDLLSNSEEVVKPFKEQVKQLNLDLQSREADVIMAKELRSKAEEQLKKLHKTIEDKNKELLELQSKCKALEEQKPHISNGGDKGHVEDAKAIAAENMEAKMRASEKKLSQKENELRKIARKMHNLKLMVITEEVEEEENSASGDGLARKIEGSVDQLLNEKQSLRRHIEDLRREVSDKDEQLQSIRSQLELTHSSMKNQSNEISSKLDHALQENEALKKQLQEAQKHARDIESDLEKLECSYNESRQQQEELLSKCDQFATDSKTLTERLAALSSELDAKTKLISEKHDQVESLNKENAELLNRLKEATENRQEPQAMLNLIDIDQSEGNSLDDTTKENELLRKQITELEQKCQSLNEQLNNFSALNQSSKDNTDDVKELQAKLVDADKQLAINNEKQASHVKQVELLNQEIKALHDSLSQKTTELADSDAKLQETMQLRDEHAKQTDALKEKLLQTESERASVGQNLAEERALLQKNASELESLTAKVEELSSSLDNEKRKVSDLSTELEAVRKEKDDLQGYSSQTEQQTKQKLDELLQQLNQTRSEHQKMKDDLEKSKQAKSILEKELKSKLIIKEQDAESAIQKWETAQKEKNSLETKLLEMENDHEAKRSLLNDEIRALNSKLEQLEARLKDNPEEDLRHQLEKQAAELDEAKSKAQEASNDAEQMKKAVEIKSQELIKMVDDLAAQERLLKEAESRIIKLEAHYKEWIRSLELKQSESDDKLSQCERERDAFQQNADRLDKMYVQLENQLKQVQQEGKLRVADVEARLIVEKDKMKKLEDAKVKLEANKFRLETALKTEEEHVQKLKQEKAKMEDELKEKALECESWEESLKTGDERNTKIRQELKEAQSTIDDLRKEIELKEDKLREEYEQRLVSMQLEKDKLNDQLGNVREELSQTQNSVRQIQEELEALKQSPVQQENLQLRQTLKQIEEDRERLIKESDKMKEELAMVSKQAALLGKEAKALRDCNGDEIDTLREQMDEFKNQSILAQERCDKLQKELDSLRKQMEDKEDGWGHDGWTEGEWGDRDDQLKNDDQSTPAVLEVAVEESKAQPQKNPHEGCDSVDALRLQLAKQQDEIRDLKALLGLHSRSGLMADMPGPTEYEYLKNIMFNFMMGKETQTLCKVIAAVLRFSNEQTRLVTERHESLHKVSAVYHQSTANHTNRPH